jgi:hypothetical protein
MTDPTQITSEEQTYLQLKAKADEYLLSHPSLNKTIGKKLFQSIKMKGKLIVMYSLMIEIINLNGIVFGGFVRDTLRFFEEINRNEDYNIYGDPTDFPFLNDLDVIITKTSFDLLIKYFKFNKIKYYESNSSFSHYPTPIGLIGYVHKKFFIVYNNITITVDFLISNKKTVALNNTHFKCDFDVNSLYIRKCDCIDYINKEIKTCTNTHYGKNKNRHIIGSLLNIDIKKIFESIQTKSATCVFSEENSTTEDMFDYRLYKIENKGYKVSYLSEDALFDLKWIPINCLNEIPDGIPIRIYRDMLAGKDDAIDLDNVSFDYDLVNLEIFLMDYIGRALVLG